MKISKKFVYGFLAGMSVGGTAAIFGASATFLIPLVFIIVFLAGVGLLLDIMF